MSISLPAVDQVATLRRALISVGVDGSPEADAALSWAINEAVLRGDAVEAVSVWPYPLAGSSVTGGPLWGGRPSDVDAALARVGYCHQVPVEVEIRFGFAGPALRDEADAASAELVVIGRSEEPLVYELLVGSVSHVLRQAARRPVVVVPPRSAALGGPPAGQRKLLVVGVDGSPRSVVGLRWAIREATLRHARVRAVLAWDSAGSLPAAGAVRIGPSSTDGSAAGAAAAGRTRADETAAEEADRLVAATVAEALEAEPASAEVTVDALAVRGTAIGVLLDQAAAADLLVVGHEQRTVIGEAILGSTTRACLRHSVVPVVVVPRPRPLR